MNAKMGKVLIADSEPESRAALMWFLLSKDFRVEAVSNGLDAAAALDHGFPDVAIVSLYLPVFDGRRLIDHMRGSPRLCRVPIVATGPARPFAPLPAGVEFRLKSASPSEYLEAIARVTNGQMVVRPRVPVPQGRMLAERVREDELLASLRLRTN